MFEGSEEIFIDSNNQKQYDEITVRLKYLHQFCNTHQGLMENLLLKLHFTAQS